MNVNALNTITSMQKLSSAPAFKCATPSVNEEAPNVNLNGLFALGAMSQPCKHTTTISFDESGKKLSVSSGIATLDNSQQKECSSLELDRKEGKSTSDLVQSFIQQTKDFGEISAKFRDGSVATVLAMPHTKGCFDTILTKNGKSEVIHQAHLNKEVGKVDAEEYKRAAYMSLSSLGLSNVESVTISSQK